MENREINLKKASSFYLIGTLFNKGIGFITVPVFTRILTTSDYGIVTTYGSWVSIISIFMSLALYMGIRLSFIDYEKRVNDYLTSILLFTLGYGFCISAIICVVAYVLPLSVNIGLIVLCLLEALGIALIEEISQFLLMQIKYKIRTAIMIVPNLLSTFVSIVIIRTVLNNNLYLGRILPSAFITFAIGIGLALYFLPKGKLSIDKEYLKHGLKISLPLVFHAMALNILSQSDRMMLTLLRNSSETGIYGLIYNFSMIATVITSAFDGIWVPFFTNKMKNKLEDVINKYSIKYIELMTVAMIGVVMIGPEVVKLLSTNTYWEGISIIPPIVLSNFIIFIYTLYVYVEHYYKKTVSISINTSIAAILNIILNYFFINRWGYMGAAYSTVICYGISLIFHYICARRLNKNVLPLKQMIIPMITVIGVSLLFYIFIDMWIVRWSIAFAFSGLIAYKERKFVLKLLYLKG